jgi:hypothetical protein
MELVTSETQKASVQGPQSREESPAQDVQAMETTSAEDRTRIRTDSLLGPAMEPAADADGFDTSKKRRVAKNSNEQGSPLWIGMLQRQALTLAVWWRLVTP